jgi:hypothetical protein
MRAMDSMGMGGSSMNDSQMQDQHNSKPPGGGSMGMH